MKTATVDLFAEEPSFDDDSSIKINRAVTDDFWLKYIGAQRVVDEAAFARILEDNNWFPGEIQDSLGRLILQEKSVNLNAIKPRPKKPLHYAVPGGERLRITNS